MPNELSLTQPARVTHSSIAEAETRVRDMLDRVWRDRDASVAAQFLMQSDAVEHLTSLMRAEFLYGLSVDWTRNGMHGEFYGWAFQKLGKDRLYIERRVRVGALLTDLDVPARIRNDLKRRSMDELIMIASAWADDVRPDVRQWHNLLDAANSSEIGAALRDIQGKPPRSNCLTIYYRDDGELEAWRDGQVATGWLRFEGDPDVAKAAFNRVVRSSKLVRKENT